jgi:hypothetical protein
MVDVSVLVGDSQRDVGEKEAVVDRVAVRLGVWVIVFDEDPLAVIVEEVVTVLVRLGVRVPEAVTDGVPVTWAVGVAGPDAVPDAVTVGVPVFVVDGLCVVVRLLVELMVVDRVAVIVGRAVPLEDTEAVLLGVAVMAPVPEIDGVCVGVLVPDPVLLEV